MEEIFTLFMEKKSRSTEEMIQILDRIYASSIFDSHDFYSYLDTFHLKAPKEVVKRIKDFHDSSLQIPLLNHEIAEIILN